MDSRLEASLKPACPCQRVTSLAHLHGVKISGANLALPEKQPWFLASVLLTAEWGGGLIPA